MYEVKKIQFKLPVREGRRRTIEIDMRKHLKKYPDAMRVCDIAEALSCSKNTVYEWIETKELFSVTMGRKIIVPKTVLIDYLINQKYYIVKKEKK